jgi:hypothetical protein
MKAYYALILTHAWFHLHGSYVILQSGVRKDDMFLNHIESYLYSTIQILNNLHLCRYENKVIWIKLRYLFFVFPLLHDAILIKL